MARGHEPKEANGRTSAMRFKGLLTSFLVCLAAAWAMPDLAAARVSWIVRGAGFGHGVGMSAYGAYGYGLHGYGYQQILRHYYSGTQVTRLTTARRVRVLLEVSSGDVYFRGATTACGRRLSSGAVLRAHLHAGAVVLLSRAGRLLARCGKRLRAVGSRRISVEKLGAYRGSLILVPTRRPSGSLNVINDVEVNDYARGSVPSEVFPSWPSATLRAMAVACRSIALTTDVGGNGFELYADTRTQNYFGMRAESPRTDAAVTFTSNQVVTYHGNIAQTTYFSASGGKTESGFLGAPEVPYLKSVDDPYDYYAPLHRWTLRFSQSEIDSRLGPLLKGSLRRVVVTKRGDSPRIDYARLVGTRGTTRVTGDQLRSTLGLYDRWAYFTRVT